MPEFYLLSAADRDLLQELLRDKSRNKKEMVRGNQIEPAVSQAPEVYVARTGETGIAALTDEAGTGSGTHAGYDRPGVADCDIYRLFTIDGINQLEPVEGLSREVFNLSLTAIDPNTWILVARDKFGRWYTILGVIGAEGPTGPTGATGSTGATGAGSDSCACCPDLITTACCPDGVSSMLIAELGELSYPGTAPGTAGDGTLADPLSNHTFRMLHNGASAWIGDLDIFVDGDITIQLQCVASVWECTLAWSFFGFAFNASFNLSKVTTCSPFSYTGIGRVYHNDGGVVEDGHISIRIVEGTALILDPASNNIVPLEFGGTGKDLLTADSGLVYIPETGVPMETANKTRISSEALEVKLADNSWLSFDMKTLP